MSLIHGHLVVWDKSTLKPIWIIFVLMASQTAPVKAGAENLVPAFALCWVFISFVGIPYNKDSPLQTAAL